jgi:hypothetical protein
MRLVGKFRRVKKRRRKKNWKQNAGVRDLITLDYAEISRCGPGES